MGKMPHTGARARSIDCHYLCAMPFDSQSARHNLNSLEGLNEWSLFDRDLLITTLLDIVAGLEELSNDADDLA
jgi:hypothetical protein